MRQNINNKKKNKSENKINILKIKRSKITLKEKKLS